MIQEMVVQKLVARVREYDRKITVSVISVNSGIATPCMAAQLLQEYGRGVADSAAAFYGSESVTAYYCGIG